VCDLGPTNNPEGASFAFSAPPSRWQWIRQLPGLRNSRAEARSRCPDLPRELV